MRRAVVLPTAVLGLVVILGGPAAADHTNPLSTNPVAPQPSAGALTAGKGSWQFLSNLGPMQGTDLEFFSKNGINYVSGGTLGQGPAVAPGVGSPGFVGQRIVQLTDAAGAVAPKVVADHFSAACTGGLTTSATGLQHDVQAVPRIETELLIDATDATGRCHDTPGGGLEIIDVTGLGTAGFQPREIGLIRLNTLSHNVTADPARPGILYNSGSDFGTDSSAMNWIDVVDVRSCLGLTGKTLAEKRAACLPEVTRFPFEKSWTQQRLPDGTLTEPANCHDITVTGNRLYCAALNATLILDVAAMLDPVTNKVAGAPLPCTVTAGTATAAKVTDCALKPAGVTSANPTADQARAAYDALSPRPQATGISFVGTRNHAGRNCSPVSAKTCNTNTVVTSDQGVAVAHEAEPTPDGRFMFVTDERGGGVLPPGATCAPSVSNPIGNGGLHVYDISNPGAITPAKLANGKPAVYIGTSPTPSPSFCTIHVIEQIPGENRLVAAYYDGGTKVVDYAIALDGTWSFAEVAAYRLPGANTWSSEVFRTVDNLDGTRTYFFVSNSFALGQGTARGLDVFSWTGPAANQAVAQAIPSASPTGRTDTGTPSPQPATAAGGPTLSATGSSSMLALAAAVVSGVALAITWMRRRRLG